MVDEPAAPDPIPHTAPVPGVLEDVPGSALGHLVRAQLQRGFRVPESAALLVALGALLAFF